MIQGTPNSLMVDEIFHKVIADLGIKHRPSRHSFFSRLAAYPTAELHSPPVLNELYKRYQSAMHASRAMGYFLPHLDTIALRIRKLRILADDDGIPGGDTHHFQLRRTWTSMLGCPPLMKDDEFGELDDLKKCLDPMTTAFVTLVQEIYPQSLGPWVMVEGLAHDWIGALLTGLIPHFEAIDSTDYFMENFSNCLEEKHAQEALDVTSIVLCHRPELLEETIEGARRMGEGLDMLWSTLESVLIVTK